MFFIIRYKNKKRIIQVLALFLTILILLGVRLFFLQLYPTEKVVAQYENHQSEQISDSKYEILDTNENSLIKYNNKYVLVIDSKPFSLNNYEETLKDLMALNFIMKGEDDKFNFTNIMKSNGKVYYEISEDTYKKINSLKDIKGIYTYVYSEVDRKKAWMVSSFLSKIENNKIENTLLWKIDKYVENNKLPMEDFYLDSKGIYSENKINISEENKNIKLTINKDFEERVREVLKKEEYEELDNVAVMIMEAETGKIRTMVQKDESEANLNLAIEGIGYEPGSIYKLITLGAALDKGVITLENTFSCNSQICAKNNCHGFLTVEEALVKSCNDVFGKVGNLVGYETLMEYSEKQGLFNRVLNLQGDGINESEGVKPTIEAGMNNISIGQCFNVTPIQMLGAINTITNNGVYVKPYLIENILDKDNNVVEEFSSESTKVYNQITTRLLKKSMKSVVERGTGKKAMVEGIDIGGKTGSATSGTNSGTHGWFVGYFNINEKYYTMIVFVPNIQSNKENGEEVGGGSTAAPIFKDIVEKLVY